MQFQDEPILGFRHILHFFPRTWVRYLFYICILTQAILMGFSGERYHSSNGFLRYKKEKNTGFLVFLLSPLGTPMHIFVLDFYCWLYLQNLSKSNYYSSFYPLSGINHQNLPPRLFQYKLTVLPTLPLFSL